MTYKLLTSRILLQMKPYKAAQNLTTEAMAWEAQNSFFTFWDSLRHNLMTTVLNGL